jgi:UMF1 family MFS transporter
MILAMLLGVFMGPVQAASRTLAGRLATEGSIAQTYGLYAFTGKSIAFVGPLLYGLMTDIFQTQQAGMMVIVTLWCLGLALIWFVRENKA